MAKRSTDARISALVFFVSMTAGLLLLEGFVRAVFWNQVDTRSLEARPAAASVVPFIRRSADPDLLYELKPGVRLIGWGGIRVETDSSGCRVAPGSRDADSGPPRIAVVGDSSPFGWKVPFEATYGEQLRLRLQRALGKPVAVKNYSVPGYNSLQNLATFRDKVLRWHPDLLLLHYDNNDADPSDDDRTRYMDPAYGDNILHSMLLKFVVRRWHERATRMTVVVGADAAHPERLYEGYRYEGPQFEFHMRQMKAIADLAAARGIPVVVFLWNPWLTRTAEPESDPFYTLLHRPVSRRLRGFGYRVVDSYPLYQEFMRKNRLADLQSLWNGPDDAHPSAEGHRVIAGFLYPTVLGLLRATAPERPRS
ncbi:MAG: SGNH/GDSL hydrolase family protein [Elusimicrobiota bacterium]